MIQVLLKEINSFLNSLIAYVVMATFLTGIGLLMWVFPETNVLDYGYAEMDTLFTLGPYVFLFLIPAITMKVFAEEKKAGTLEFLLTKPLTDWQIILGKYLAGVVLVVFSLLPTSVYYLSVSNLGNPAGNIDTAGVIGSYVGLTLLGALFAAIGIFASAISQNQIVSFILAVFLSFMFYAGFNSLAGIDVWGDYSPLIAQWGVQFHYNAMGKGLLDSRDIVYFFSVIALMLMLTKLILGIRKW